MVFTANVLTFSEIFPVLLYICCFTYAALHMLKSLFMYYKSFCQCSLHAVLKKGPSHRWEVVLYLARPAVTLSARYAIVMYVPICLYLGNTLVTYITLVGHNNVRIYFSVPG